MPRMRNTKFAILFLRLNELPGCYWADLLLQKVAELKAMLAKLEPVVEQVQDALTHNKKLPKVRIFQSRCLTLEVTLTCRNIRLSFVSMACLSIKGFRVW
jgi:hypothetical protein